VLPVDGATTVITWRAVPVPNASGRARPRCRAAAVTRAGVVLGAGRCEVRGAAGVDADGWRVGGLVDADEAVGTAAVDALDGRDFDVTGR